MHKLKQILKQFTRGCGGCAKKVAEHLATAVFAVGLIALCALIFFAVKPVRTADIKVPVATDLASYYPGQAISGIFFGDTYYTGHIQILREIFCSNYKGIITPPATQANGDLLSTSSRARHLEGVNAFIGYLPTDVPIGKNCVLQFTNIYHLNTPFGTREVDYVYYTQNFSIVSQEHREQLDSGGTSTNTTTTVVEPSSTAQNDASMAQPTQTAPQTTTNNTTTNNSTTNNNTETAPVTPPAPTCTVNLLGIKIGCKDN